MNFKLEEPISISFNTWTHQENVLVKLKYGEHVGMGEAAPFKPITLDSQDEVIEQLRNLGTIDLDPETTSFQEFHDYLDGKITGHTARAALDFAYHDLVGKMKGVPVYKLYSASKNIVSNSITIFIKDKEAMGKDAAKIMANYPHIKLIKIKLKGDADDIDKVKAVREAVTKDIQFTVDANQGFQTSDEAVRVLNEIGEILGNVLLVEEPLPKGRLDELKQVTEQVKGMYVFADESAVDVDDAKKVIAKQAAHGINIKLQKAGGIWQGKLMAQLAEEAGIKVMVGSMLEGPLANAASVNFAASTPNVIMTDLDMDLPMKPHTKTMCSFENGTRQPLELPGLGIEYDEDKLKELMEAGELIYEKVV